MRHVLLVEDHIGVAQMVMQLLAPHQCQVAGVRTLTQAMEAVERRRYDLVILDIGLPDGSGLECLTYLQQNQRAVPVLVLSGKGAVQDRIVALRLGADDYVTKPFYGEELVLRVESLLSKVKRLDGGVVSVGTLTVSLESGQVRSQRGPVRLRKREFEIFAFLAKHKNALISRETLLNHIWPSADIPTYKTIDVYIRRIRMMLGEEKKYLRTLRGFGYVLQDKPDYVYSAHDGDLAATATASERASSRPTFADRVRRLDGSIGEGA